MSEAETIRLPQHIIDKFLERIAEPDPITGCMLWLGRVNEDGYGCFTIPASAMPDGKKRTVYAHRMAYSLIVGPIDDGLEACHEPNCTDRACCNPDHIRPDTHAENNRDIARMAASRKPRQLDFMGGLEP